MRNIPSVVDEIQSDLVAFAQRLVQIRSYSGAEEAIIRSIEATMHALGYDETYIDRMGNLVGRIGQGRKVMLFDSHVDTVSVDDASQWRHPPFGGVIVDGRLHGRGSVDMKSAAAASIYAAAAAKKAGAHADKTIYVSCTVMEEDCDGENLKHLLGETGIRPDVAVICEPSGNRLVTGHKGKAQVVIRTQGTSAHAASPCKGQNAIYAMAEIIRRVERTATALMQAGGRHGTLTLSRISSLSASLNAVPFACDIDLDRRLAWGEGETTLKKEMDAIVAGSPAAWRIGDLQRKSWTGMAVRYHPLHLPWRIDDRHPLTRTGIAAYRTAFGTDPQLDFWDFSTNAVATVAMGIPTIGFGPGAPERAHTVDESCQVRQIVDACLFYGVLMDTLA